MNIRTSWSGFNDFYLLNRTLSIKARLRYPRSDPPRLHLSSCQLVQILKYPPLAKPVYDYPHAPLWPLPSPYTLIINSF